MLLYAHIPQLRIKKRTTCCSIIANRIEQCFAAHIVHSCQQYRSALLHLIRTQQYVHYCRQLRTTWPTQHCLILVYTMLRVFGCVVAVILSLDTDAYTSILDQGAIKHCVLLRPAWT